MSKKKSVVVRNATLAEVPQIVAVAAKAYTGWSSRQLANERNYQMQISTFPEGQFVALWEDQVVGYCSSLIVYLDDDSPWYAHGEITGFSSFSTHDPSGNTLYGADIAVDPDYQGKGISKKLYAARKALLRRHNLKQMIAGGRIPGYGAYRGKMTAKEYVASVFRGELRDKALNADIRAGYEIRGVHFGYIEDEHSLGYSTHLVLFPELFIAQMLTTLDRDKPLPELVGELAGLHGRYLDLFTTLASSRQLLIIAGSVPVRQPDGSISNVAHLFSPVGNVYTQEKLHLTPAAATYWGFSQGEGLKVFDTPIGRLVILICYDIEFPELSRLLVDAGVDLIVVPCVTDERKAYVRVRYCAQARAVENTIDVALAGNVGALPRSPAMSINFGQVAVLTPSDFAFPLNGVAAEGVVNTQTVVICDIDLGALEIEREVANVRPLIDRRPDIYSGEGRIRIENCKVS